MASTVRSTCERSVLPFGDEGVPTQINTTSASLRAGEISVVACSLPELDRTLHELVEARFCHRRDPTRHGRDLLDIDVDRPDVVGCLGEARGGHRAHVPESEHCDLHVRHLLPSLPHEARARAADTEVARGGIEQRGGEREVEDVGRRVPEAGFRI